MKRIISFLLVLVISIAVFSCSGMTGGDEDNTGTNETVFNSQYRDESGKLKIENGLNTKVVLFKNVLRQSEIIDIMQPLEKQTYKLDKDGFTVLMGVLYTDYETKPLNELNPIYYELFYYNSMGEIYETFVEDNPIPTGSSEITFNNKSAYWIELHKEHEKGELMTVLPPESVTKLNIMPDEYDIFPVFVILMKAGFNERIVGMEKKVLKNGIWTRRYDPDQEYVETIKSEEMEDLLIYDKGYLSVVNNSDDGFRVLNGASKLITGNQYSLINPGERLVFELEQVGMEYNQLKISAARLEDDVAIPSIYIEKGLVYEINITDTYEATIVNSEGTPVNEFKEKIGN